MVKRRWSRRNSPRTPWNPGSNSVSCSANGGATVQRNWRRQRQLSWRDTHHCYDGQAYCIPKSIKVYFTKSDEGYIDRYQMSMHFFPATDKKGLLLKNTFFERNSKSSLLNGQIFKRICWKSVSRIELWVDAAFVKQKPLKRFKNSSWDNHQLRCRFWSRLGTDCCCCPSGK